MPALSPPVAKPHVPTFTPVPVRARCDGWTAQRQRAFIATLAETLCVGAAARAAGVSRESAYRLRRRKGAESFAASWKSIVAARPRGTSSPALVWHRLVRKAGGRGAVRIEEPAPTEREALHDPAPGPARRRPAARKVTLKFRRAFRELHAPAALQIPDESRAGRNLPAAPGEDRRTPDPAFADRSIVIPSQTR